MCVILSSTLLVRSATCFIFQFPVCNTVKKILSVYINFDHFNVNIKDSKPWPQYKVI